MYKHLSHVGSMVWALSWLRLVTGAGLVVYARVAPHGERWGYTHLVGSGIETFEQILVRCTFLLTDAVVIILCWIWSTVVESSPETYVMWHDGIEVGKKNFFFFCVFHLYDWCDSPHAAANRTRLVYCSSDGHFQWSTTVPAATVDVVTCFD